MKPYTMITDADPNKYYEGHSGIKKRRLKEDDSFFDNYIAHALDYVEKRFKIQFGEFKLYKNIEGDDFGFIYISDIEHKKLGVLSLVFKNCGLMIKTSTGPKQKVCVKFELKWETFVGERDGAPIGKLLIGIEDKKTLWKDGE